MIRLVTDDTRVSARFYATGGDLYADGRRITLGEAHRLMLGWEGSALNSGRKGNRAQAHTFRRDASALETAARDCALQRRALGWADVLAADRAVAS